MLAILFCIYSVVMTFLAYTHWHWAELGLHGMQVGEEMAWFAIWIIVLIGSIFAARALIRYSVSESRQARPPSE